jgi:hypothetical protein
MFLLLVTNRGSNILEDLDTLRLLSKLVPEYAGSMLDEEAVSAAAFDLIFAFDEVISLGHKENISVLQVCVCVGCGVGWMCTHQQQPQQHEGAQCSSAQPPLAPTLTLHLTHRPTPPQVKQNCEMESHEEKLHKMIIQSKINDTKDVMKRKVRRCDVV